MRRRAVVERLDRALVELGDGPIEGGSVDGRLDRLDRAIVETTKRLDEAVAGRQLLTHAIDHLKVGVVVVTEDEVVHRNEVARQYAAGRPSDALVEAGIGEIVGSVRTGASQSRIVRLMGPPRQTLELDGRTTPLGGSVVIIRDVSANERLDQVRRDFVANISHELKTPIGALTLLAETLEDESDPDDVRRLSARVLTEASRAASIVEDLLELSRVESGEAHEDLPLAVADLVDEARDLVRSAAEDGGVRVTVAVNGALAVTGDRRQLVSALVNLLDNAVRYSDTGDEVAIEAGRAGDEVEISVVDQGVGIPARDLDRVFERFYRVDRSRSRDRGGTGLGLSIVRHVVDNHGGAASITSVEGRGTSVVLRLPSATIGEVPADG